MEKAKTLLRMIRRIRRGREGDRGQETGFRIQIEPQRQRDDRLKAIDFRQNWEQLKHCNYERHESRE